MKTPMIISLLFLFASTCSFTQNNIHKSRRKRMVTNQIQLRGMDHEPTLNAMGTVPLATITAIESGYMWVFILAATAYLIALLSAIKQLKL